MYDARISENNTSVCPKCNMRHEISCNNTFVLGIITKQVQKAIAESEKSFKNKIFKLILRLVVIIDIIIIVLLFLFLNNIIKLL